LAESNGGKPLGEIAFRRETGIGQHVWFGKYWARWGDALLEAGYEANKMVVAYADDFLYAKLAQVVLYYQKTPVKAELSIYKKNVDPDFPSFNVFIRHFHKVTDMWANLYDWASKDGEYSEVIKYLPSKRIELSNIVISRMKDDYVYLFKCGNFYKIGRTGNVDRRYQEIKTQMPSRMEEIHRILTDDSIGIESYWHKRFDGKRRNGEWFELNAQDVAAFRRRKFQ
jgi:hypothetical protein